MKISESIILKVGFAVQMEEAEVMYIIQKMTSVSVPRVLNAYIMGNIGFIFMDKVQSILLNQC